MQVHRHAHAACSVHTHARKHTQCTGCLPSVHAACAYMSTNPVRLRSTHSARARTHASVHTARSVRALARMHAMHAVLSVYAVRTHMHTRTRTLSHTCCAHAHTLACTLHAECTYQHAQGCNLVCVRARVCTFTHTSALYTVRACAHSQPKVRCSHTTTPTSAHGILALGCI
jgi:hypothetical protein